MNFELVPCGDRGLLVRFGDAIDEATNRRVLGLAQALSHPALIDVIPTYASVLIEYDPIRLRYDDLCELVLRAAALSRTAQQEGQTVEIPVVYDGPDLAEVARLTGLTEAEVVARHTAEPYRVYGLGFSPGFPYLGGLDPALAVPRLGEPRVKVPAGSVGIGGEQTGIYPQAGPGGWHLIGRTGVALFDPRRAKPSLLAPGDTVRFVQVNEAPVEAPAPPPPVSERGPGLKVIKPGLLTTVQDLGRRGWQHLGVSVAGAVDYWALMVGNWLVANRSRTAALEITLQGPELAFTGPAAFAITGAPIPAELVPAGGGSPLPLEPWVSYLAGPGDLLRFGSAPVGCRSYLCVAGGFDLPPVLGSLSQDLFGGLGPLPGPLAAGDFVPFGEPLLPPGYLAGRRLPLDALDRYGEAFAGRLTARVVAGPQADLVQPEGLATLYGQPFTVGAQSDRQGLRLEGPPIQLQPGAGDLLSEGMPPGGLQVTADGRLMLMLVNRQTAGGYPKPAVAVYSDLPLIGQLRPGSTLRFTEVDLAEAHQIAWGQRRELAQVRRYLQREAIGLHGIEAGQKPQPVLVAQPAVRPSQVGVSSAAASAAPSSEPRRFMVRIGGTQFEVKVVEEKS